VAREPQRTAEAGEFPSNSPAFLRVAKIVKLKNDERGAPRITRIRADELNPAEVNGKKK